MIKYIHCFGTSYTAGGGHEFDATGPGRKPTGNYLQNLSKSYSEKWPNEEQTLYNCSWPGQLQKLLPSDVKVFNYAKSGYGNERMYKLAWEIIRDSNFNKNENLFMFEFSALGRKELWSNTLNDEIITNYNIDEKEDKFVYNGAANDYFYDSQDKINLIDKISKEIIEPFYKETLSLVPKMRNLEMNNEFFLAYLNHNNINFLLTAEPFYNAVGFRKENTINFGENYKYISFVNYFHDKDLTITKETNGKVIEGHMGMTGAKYIANCILKRLIELNFIKKEYLLI